MLSTFCVLLDLSGHQRWKHVGHSPEGEEEDDQSVRAVFCFMSVRAFGSLTA